MFLVCISPSPIYKNFSGLGLVEQSSTIDLCDSITTCCISATCTFSKEISVQVSMALLHRGAGAFGLPRLSAPRIQSRKFVCTARKYDKEEGEEKSQSIKGHSLYTGKVSKSSIISLIIAGCLHFLILSFANSDLALTCPDILIIPLASLSHDSSACLVLQPYLNFAFLGLYSRYMSVVSLIYHQQIITKDTTSDNWLLRELLLDAKAWQFQIRDVGNMSCRSLESLKPTSHYWNISILDTVSIWSGSADWQKWAIPSIENLYNVSQTRLVALWQSISSKCSGQLDHFLLQRRIVSFAVVSRGWCVVGCDRHSSSSLGSLLHTGLSWGRSSRGSQVRRPCRRLLLPLLRPQSFCSALCVSPPSQTYTFKLPTWPPLQVSSWLAVWLGSIMSRIWGYLFWPFQNIRPWLLLSVNVELMA